MMSRKEFHIEATKLGYTKEEINNVIATIEGLEADGIVTDYKRMLIEKPTTYPRMPVKEEL